ncbi:MAG: hypothetical protein B6D62_02825 [Candidatus Cloacimonas sp. 4484_275]|jgi:heterodisulfide reductase subunit C|nr:MAG: hypothetical protein B6D62_02825 [Candidatus Cloacimonas sp. 4484_275]RLC52366.1 MAG: heterodisulfide reductase [Candidatus Cloacimonadota bacterium]
MPKNKKIVLSSAKVRSNEDLDKLKEISEENIFSCYQCGNCSAGCPAAEFMDEPPHKIIRLLQLGLIKEAMYANSSWICAACIYCTVECPRGVDIAKVMEALRQIALRKGVNHVNIDKLSEKILEKLPQIALISNFRKFTL